MVTIDNIDRIDETTSLISFSSNLATPVPFRIYQDGVLVASYSSSTGSGTFEVSVSGSEATDIQILDDGSVPRPSYPGHVTVHWFAVEDAFEYRIEELVGATWTLRDIQPDDGEEAWTWLSGWLNDVTVYQFRVIAVDVAGNESAPQSFIVEMVRTPDVPNVRYSWNSGTGKITIASN